MRWEFNIDDGGDDTVRVVNEFLNTEERATERAEAEMLEVAYQKKEISFTTTRTDLILNNIYNISGIPYIIKSIEYNIGTSILCTIQCERYET